VTEVPYGAGRLLTAIAVALLCGVLSTVVAHAVSVRPAARERALHVLRHPGAAVAAALLAVGGAVLWWLGRGAGEPPRRYADYLPADSAAGGGLLLGRLREDTFGPLLLCAGIVLITSWLTARAAGHGSRTNRLRLATFSGVLLVVVGVVVWYRLRLETVSFGWYMYSPLTDETFPADPSGGWPARDLLGVAIAALGLIQLGAVSGVRWGRGQQQALPDAA
jgi:hypothetical protein